MMNKQTRLSRLETQATKLPPDGAYLGSVYERLPENEREAWLRARTDDELMAMMQQHAKYGGLDIDRLTEDELEALCRIDDDAKYDEWLGQLRAAKPHYFSEGRTMTKKRLAAIEEKASRVFTTREILNQAIRPIFQVADASVTNAEHLASFKAQVLTIVSQHLNIPVEVVREFFS